MPRTQKSLNNIVDNKTNENNQYKIPSSKTMWVLKKSVCMYKVTWFNSLSWWLLKRQLESPGRVRLYNRGKICQQIGFDLLPYFGTDHMPPIIFQKCNRNIHRRQIIVNVYSFIMLIYFLKSWEKSVVKKSLRM